MANNGAGTKFVSVNLNKSYGQQSHPSYQGSSFGSNRARPFSHGGGGGGTVVLSRPKSSQKVGAKLSVPPPLNLPSMKKEHERFDPSGSGSGATGGGALGTGSRPNSSGMGWTKPAIQEKDETQVDSIDVVSKGNSIYTPPSGRPGALSGSSSVQAYPRVDKAMILRGEDFPSLGATLTANSGPSQKQKDGLNSKQKLLMVDDAPNKQLDNSNFNTTQPHVQSGHHSIVSDNRNGVYGIGISDSSEKYRKQANYSSVSLPLVRLSPRSNWEDDERDTGHSISHRSRENNVLKHEGYQWDREFDMPKINNFPSQKPTHNVFSEVSKAGSYGKDMRTSRDVLSNREGPEGNLWRSNFATKTGFNNGQEDVNNRNGVGPRSSIMNREISNKTVDSFYNRGVERNTWGRYNNDQYNRNISNYTNQNNSVSKSAFNVSGKLNSEKPYVDDPLLKDFGVIGFDGRDPFTGAPVGVVKRKKDAAKQTDFHDPVRKSFEAELERVQKMQEQERQRFVEEQERAMDLVRREEEERERIAREEEERQRRNEEEAREAVFRAEQERIDAIRRSEEQKIAREEEKRIIAMEEERRKQAAKQKLLELEEKISRRKTEATIVADNKIADAGENGERMVERISTSASSDEVGSRSHISSFNDRGKPFSSWRRDIFENDHNSNIFLQEPRVDLDFQEDLGEKFGDIGWGQTRPHGNPHFTYPERHYQNQESDGLYFSGRSRFSMRQPRVPPPPPPSLGASVQNSSLYRREREIDSPGPSVFLDGEFGSGLRENLQLSELIDNKPEEPEIEFEEQKMNIAATSRCDSQSSLSVSSPPTSPNPLSHDDLDESPDPPLLSTSEGKGNFILASNSVSVGDDDEEWTVENNERLQEQEEYDEVEDGYQEEDEVHEGDDDNIDLTHEFEIMNMEEKSNFVVGFNEGVKVELPSDEFEKSSMNEEPAFALPHAVHHTDASSTSSSQFMQLPGSSSASSSALKFSVVPTVMSTGPVAQIQSELPVKLQMGLYPNPPLIPSSVPAIQIGLIQIPLHLNPHVGPPLSQMHQSQHSLFQFGQFRYSSPISQGILPLAPQPMSLVPPNYLAQLSPNENSGGPSSIPAGQDTSSNIVQNVEGPTDYNEVSENSMRSEVDIQAKPSTISKSYAPLAHRSKAPGPVSGGGRGKKFVFAAKNSGPRLPFVGPEALRVESSSGFQRRHQNYIPRTEFRIRDNADRRQLSGMYNSNINERGTELPKLNGSKRSSVSAGYSNQTLATDSFNSDPLQDIDFGSRPEKDIEKKALIKIQGTSRHGEGSSNRNVDENNDEHLGSGIVHVYEQPGIEAPSDYDDFIEVRSKRQMLNDRREQREKEIKAKSRLTKAPRTQRSTTQSTTTASSSNKNSASVSGESTNRVRSEFVISKGRSLVNPIVSPSFNSTTVSQPLAPIGTPVNNEDQALKSIQTTSTLHVISGSEINHGSGSIFETQSSKVLDHVQTSLGTWGNARIDQQVMDLTQNQLDEAMRPVRFDARVGVASLGDRKSTVSELNNMPSTSPLAKDKQFTSSASPINSLLAGEKIQFGAVTSPTVLPPSSRSMSHGIGPSVESGCNSLFYQKEKHATDEQDSEAVAVITSDTIVAPPTSSNVKSFGGTNGVNISQEFASQSRAKESSLSVALPADLSVETPPISMWAPSQTSQNSTPQSFTPFHAAGPTSHFPYPMLAPSIFGYSGPYDQSIGPQQQSQTQNGNNNPWPQPHSNVESFYGHPGGIPGVQGPPHMFVYNHFAPVGQFGQVGLSFMGTYDPSPKQPDWKHNPNSSSNMGISEGGTSNMNLHNHPSLPTPIQHLAPGSPLMPMAPFVSPFQSSYDMSVPPLWSHVSPSPLQSSAPMSAAPLKFSHGPLIGQSNTNNLANPNRFLQSRSSTPSENSRGFGNSSEISGTQLPDDLGLADQSNPLIPNASLQTISPSPTDSCKTNVHSEGKISSNTDQSSSQQKNISSGHAQQQNHFSGYNNYSRNRASQNNNNAEWSQRRVGFQPKNHSMGGGAEKSFHSSKMKQVYVPKQPTSGNSSTTSL